MPILNYTTEIRAEKSIGEIQRMLAAHGAQTIVIQYADERPGALFFNSPHPIRQNTLSPTSQYRSCQTSYGATEGKEESPLRYGEPSSLADSEGLG